MVLKESVSELWRHDAVRCAIVPHGQRMQVELRNADGMAAARLFVRHVAEPGSTS